MNEHLQEIQKALDEKNSKKTIKCIVWDLDHTLWDGILTEDVEVRLRNGLQQKLEELDQRGILLSIASKNTYEHAMEKLSDREKEVLDCIASGLTTQEIGEKLFISKNTVETHRKNLLYKLKARNTAELVNNAYKHRLIQ